jgi:hypothetical protein
MTYPFDDHDEFDRDQRPEKPTAPPGMSTFHSYWWKKHDPLDPNANRPQVIKELRNVLLNILYGS